jgi:branched-chain amino acid transport system ATP-binding protein
MPESVTSEHGVTDLLTVDHVTAGYGEAVAVRDVSLRVGTGEIVTLCGRNGAGKTTMLRTVMGLHAQTSGTIAFGGRDISTVPAHRRARMGLGWVPDDRGSFATLTVAESLALPPAGLGSSRWSAERVYDTFPSLAARRSTLSNRLSGGEQQMLALARVLRMGSRLVLADEPTEGLSPLLVSQVGDVLRQIRDDGVTVLLVEQNVHFAARIADRHYLLAEGRIVEELDGAEIVDREPELLAYLGM